jgi:branched-chain amino acid transport system substrate-binding protein
MVLLGLLVAALALVAAGCGGDDGGGGGGDVEALPSSSCTAIEYEGDGDPDFIVASDLPLQGSSRTQTLQMNDAIRYELEQRDWKAGDYNIAFQACDDATAQAAKWDSGKCSQNAQNYAGNDKVIGVIGTFNSGCAQIIIPVLNQAPEGGIAMMSPANTYVCITEGGPGCDSTEPDKYYPAGTRNYARVAPHDAYQGAALAEFAQSQGTTSVYILNDKEAYGLGVATNFRNAAEAVGIKIAGFEAWDPKASSYEALFRKIGQTDADAVFLGGLIDENGAQVIKDKVAVLGPNDGDVKLYVPDGFTTQQTIDEAGTAAAGMFLSVAGVPIDEFAGAGQEWAEGFAAEKLASGTPIDPYAIYGGQAAQVLLDAIEASDGTRADVIAKMFETEVTDGLIGSFEINENGDPSGGEGAVVGFTIYKATDKLETETTISPKPENVEAARGT